MMDERRDRIVRMKESGQSFVEISVHLGITATRARELYNLECRIRGNDPWKGLSNRAKTCLRRAEISNKEELMNAIKSGALHPETGPRSYGPRTHAEICRWLGMTPPVDNKMDPLFAADNSMRDDLVLRMSSYLSKRTLVACMRLTLDQLFKSTDDDLALLGLGDENIKELRAALHSLKIESYEPYALSYYQSQRDALQTEINKIMNKIREIEGFIHNNVAQKDKLIALVNEYRSRN